VVFSNYRPVSKLNTISKIVERVYLAWLSAHVKQSPNFNRFQSAYRCGHNSETALLRMLHDVYLAANRGSRTMLLQLDLSLAFYKLDISTMLPRLNIILVSLTRSYTGSVPTWHIVSSQFESVKSSCPSLNANTVWLRDPFLDQCCSLRTLRLSRCQQYSICWWRSTPYCTNDIKATSILRNCFEAVQHWFDINGLSVNPEKTVATAIGIPARQHTDGVIGTVDLGQVNLTTSHRIWSLGKIVDDTLSNIQNNTNSLSLRWKC